MTTQTQQTQYFNLHTSGVGFLNSIRVVPPKNGRGKPFYACRITALTGETENPQKRNFDVNVPIGGQAEEVIRRVETYLENWKKKYNQSKNPAVFISFKLADMWTDIYTLTRDNEYTGQKAGDKAVSVKARLINVSTVTINKNRIYSASEEANANNANAVNEPVDVPFDDADAIPF